MTTLPLQPTGTDLRSGVGDEALRLAVEQALLAVPDDGAAPVRVEVLDGIVILTGEVPTAHAAKAASSAALGCTGATAVADEVRIAGTTQHPAVAATREAAHRLHRVLGGGRGGRGAVAVEVEGAVATLTGWARYDSTKQEAVQAACSVPGIGQVQCRIHVPR